MTIENNLTKILKFTVKENETAKFVKSGTLDVLSTPTLCKYMENTCVSLLENRLLKGLTTVGYHIEIKHLAPSKIGDEITINAKLVNTNGRKLIFELIAKEKEKVIGKATHKRMIVEEKDFLESMQ